jgi:glycosyltransferase involved in cell wall biosynthesis
MVASEAPGGGDMKSFSPRPARAARTVSAWLMTRSRGRSPRGSVLLHSPSVAFQAAAGGENQLIQTGRHLEEIGVGVRLFSPWSDRISHARLLHLFGMSREGLELARVARARGVAVVLSPICWYEPRALFALEADLLRRFGSLAFWSLRRALPRVPSWRRQLLHLADAILPNSSSEAEQLVGLFAVPRDRLYVVPNGVLPSFASATPARFRRYWKSDPFVLFVGRVEPRKNPLGLIRATRALDLPLVIIGDAPPGSEAYSQECRRAGGDRVHWLGRLDPLDELLASAYAAARVFALPSWFETPGLAALEAALAGCPVVLTPYGATREYFGGLVQYARPNHDKEIQRAVSKCWRDGADPRLAQWIAKNYLWPKVARATAEVYDQVAH